MAIAHSAAVMRSPVESSMSISRGSGLLETSYASATSSSVCFPRADSTATTLVPASLALTIRRAARWMRSASATEVPPNFITTVSVPADGMAGNDSFPPVPAKPARRRLVLALLAVLALAAGAAGAVVGGRHGDESTASNVPSPGRATPEERISFLAKLVPPPAGQERRGGSPVPKSVADLARRLPIERKVAQLFLVGFRGTDTSADIFGRLRRLDLGGIVLAPGNYVDVNQLGVLAGQAAAVARERHHVPPWVFASQEGGELNSFPDLPPSTAPADLSSASEAGAQAHEAGKTLRSLGINGVLGPVLDVGGTETGSTLGARIYSDDPQEVAAYADATVRAYRADATHGMLRRIAFSATVPAERTGPYTLEPPTICSV